MAKLNVMLFVGWFMICGTVWAAPSDCEKFLDIAQQEGVDRQMEAQAEVHSLLEVPKLAVEHPFSVMDADNRALAVIQFGGVQEVADPTSPTGKVNFYPIFSGGTRLSDGRMIIGQLRAIHDLVEMAKARGHRLSLLLGPAGSGKTELMTIMGIVAEKLTSLHPDFYVFRYVWRDLSKIEGLKGQILSLAGEDPVVRCPLNDSPLALFPPHHQQVILAQAQPRIKEMVGREADPVRALCPICAHIRGEILRHYGGEKLKSLKPDQKAKLEALKNRQRRGQSLSEEETQELAALIQQGELTGKEIVTALAKHVEIRRLVFDSRESAPIIDAQPKDVDWGGLIASANPILRAAKGPGHQMAWHLDGRLLKANGSFMFLDELLRNPKDFRDVMLRAFESRMLVVGGMPTVPLDTWMLAASNKETVDELISDGGNKAFVDRMRVIPFNWSSRPHEIGKLLVLFAQKQMGVRGQKVGQKVSEGKAPEAWEEEAANLNLLFPIPEPGKPFQGPDHRYKFWIDRQGKKIHVSPHVLLFMGQVLAATRISTDPEAAKGVLSSSDPLKIINSDLFRNPVVRLKVYMGEERPTDAQLMELEEVSIRLHEGSFGISSRDGETWLETALAEAAKPQNGGCLTPQVALLTFRELLNQGTIQFPNNETRIQWEALMQAMAKAFLSRDLKMDIDTAYTRDTGVTDTTYWEVIYEMMALNDDPQATHYLDPDTNQRRVINKKRLVEIQKRYETLKGRPLAISQIALQHARSGRKNGGAEVLDNGLKEAIVAYFAERTVETARIPDLVRYADTGEGNDNVQRVYRGFIDMMLHDLGYCEHCLRQALDFVLQMQAREGQVQ